MGREERILRYLFHKENKIYIFFKVLDVSMWILGGRREEKKIARSKSNVCVCGGRKIFGGENVQVFLMSQIGREGGGAAMV